MTTTPHRHARQGTGPALCGSVTRIAVTRAAGRVRLRTEVTGDPGSPSLRPMLLGSDETSARLCLVPDGAVLLAGDAVALEVVVGPGVSLTLVEPTGVVAYNMDGAAAGWSATVELGEEATLVWSAEPFVVAGGADVTRSTRVVVGSGARLALRESIVLGRHGERPGRAHAAWGAYDAAGRPLLVETLRLGGGSALPGVLGSARVLGSVTALGIPVPATAAPEGRMDLERDGTTWRQVAHQAHTLSSAPWAAVLDALATGACRQRR